MRQRIKPCAGAPVVAPTHTYRTRWRTVIAQMSLAAAQAQAQLIARRDGYNSAYPSAKWRTTGTNIPFHINGSAYGGLMRSTYPAKDSLAHYINGNKGLPEGEETSPEDVEFAPITKNELFLQIWDNSADAKGKFPSSQAAMLAATAACTGGDDEKRQAGVAAAEGWTDAFDHVHKLARPASCVCLFVCVCVCAVRVCACACVCAGVRACERASVRA